MLRLLARRLASTVALVIVVTILTFALVHADDTHVARNILGPDASQSAVDAKRAELGLNRSVPVQFVDWASHAVKGDLGTSYYTGQSVTDALTKAIPVTFSIITLAIVFTVVISVVLGVVAATRGGVFDRIVQVTSVVGFGLPGYWIALVLVIVIALPSGGVIPATGFVSPAASVGRWFLSIVLPATALAVGGIASVAQQVRGSMIDTLRLDYIKTLRSRGISETAIILRHALRNAAAPALIVLSLTFIGMVGAAIVQEQIFAMPGIGQLATSAALTSDIPIVMGVVVFTALLVVTVNLLIDLAAAYLNPRIRGGEG